VPLVMRRSGVRFPKAARSSKALSDLGRGFLANGLANSKYEHGWHISPTCTGAGAIEAVKIAIAEAERLGGAPLPRLLPVHPKTGGPVRIKLVTGNDGAFKGAAFAKFIASQPELLHIRTRVKGQCHSA
jgi:hypothetical protein